MRRSGRAPRTWSFPSTRSPEPSWRSPSRPAMSPTEQNADFESLLLYLQQSRGFDFTGYKRSTLVRRVLKRMGGVGLTEFADYLDYLQVRPEEFAQLFNTILINVTSFLRDPEAWAFLAREVLPRILESKL